MRYRATWRRSRCMGTACIGLSFRRRHDVGRADRRGKSGGTVFYSDRGGGFALGIRLCKECGKPLPKEARYNTQFCPDCARKRKLRQYREYYHRNSAELNKTWRENYEFLKAHHICTMCHQVTVTDGKTTCPACRAKRKTKLRKKKELTEGKKLVRRARRQEKTYWKKERT